jgi:hypothetical protein
MSATSRDDRRGSIPSLPIGGATLTIGEIAARAEVGASQSANVRPGARMRSLVGPAHPQKPELFAIFVQRRAGREKGGEEEASSSHEVTKEWSSFAEDSAARSKIVVWEAR